MEDENSADLRTDDVMSISAVENVRRRMLLMEIERNEQSKFEDNLSDCERWEETSEPVSTTDALSDLPSEWKDETETKTTRSSDASTWIASEDEKPRSYYQLLELNKEPVESGIRLARVPSQYQLDALSEVFFFDIPQQYQVKCEVAKKCEAVNPARTENCAKGITPYFVNSEYVSELLM